MTAFAECRRCPAGAFNGWTENIERVVFVSGRGFQDIAIEMKQPLRLCRNCGKPVDVARAFERQLPKGFAWKTAIIQFVGGRRETAERILKF